jgi:hypothetical protein
MVRSIRITTAEKTTRACRPTGPPGWFVASMALALCLVPDQLAAQHSPPPRSIGQVRLGPVYFTPVARVESVGYQSNLFNEPNGGATGLTFGLFGGAAVELPGRKLWVSAEFGAVYTYYSNEATTQTRSLGPAVRRFYVEYRLSPRLMVYSRDGSSATVTERPNFEIDARVRRRNTDFGLGVRWAFMPRLALDQEVRYSRQHYDHDAVYQGTNLATTLNGRTFDERLQLDYRLSKITSLSFPFVWRQVRFDEETTRDGTQQSIGVGLEFNPRSQLSGGFTVGRMRLAVPDAHVDSFVGTYSSGHLSLAFADATLVEWSFQRNVSFSFNESRVYYVYRWYEVSVRQRLGEKIDVGPYWSDYQMQYPNVSGVPEPTRVYGVRMGYYRRRYRYSVDVSYWDRGPGNSQDRQYTGWRVGFTIATPYLSFSNRGMFLNGPMGIETIKP